MNDLKSENSKKECFNDFQVSLVRAINNQGFPSQYTENIYSGLIRRGIKVNIVQFVGRNFDRSEFTGIGYITHKMHFRRIEYSLILGTFLPKYSKIKSGILHLIEPNLISLVKLNSRTVVTIHDTYFLERQDAGLPKKIFTFYNKQMYSASKKAKFILTTSDFSKREIIGKLGISENKIRTIYNIIDVNFFSPLKSTLREDWKIRDSDILISNVSGIGPRKNLRMLIYALTKLPSNYKLVHVGQLSKEDNALIAKLGLSSRFYNVERASNTLLRDIYNASDVYVQPSKYEGFGRPIVEAMACGIYTIGANATAIPEIIGNKENMFNPNNLEELVDLIKNFDRNGEKFKYGKEEARMRAMLFSDQSVIPKLLEIYRKV